MAAPFYYVIQYTDVLDAKAGVAYSGADITTGNIMQMKTDGVAVVLNSSGVSFSITYDDVGYVDINTTYTFSKDCVIAIGNMITT